MRKLDRMAYLIIYQGFPVLQWSLVTHRHLIGHARLQYSYSVGRLVMLLRKLLRVPSDTSYMMKSGNGRWPRRRGCPCRSPV